MESLPLVLIKGNKMGAEGLAGILSALRADEMGALDLSDNDLRDQGCQLLAQQGSHLLASLRCLNLSGNAITSVGLDAIVRALSGSSLLQELKISRNLVEVSPVCVRPVCVPPPRPVCVPPPFSPWALGFANARNANASKEACLCRRCRRWPKKSATDNGDGPVLAIMCDAPVFPATAKGAGFADKSAATLVSRQPAPRLSSAERRRGRHRGDDGVPGARAHVGLPALVCVLLPCRLPESPLVPATAVRHGRCHVRSSACSYAASSSTRL
jgi:hypothetical protein